MSKKFKVAVLLIIVLSLTLCFVLAGCGGNSEEDTQIDTGGEETKNNQENNETPDGELINYTITFDSNGGTTVAPISQKAGTAITAPNAPTKDGFTFNGWYLDSQLSTAYTFNTMASSHITLYASWIQNYTEAQYKTMCEEKLGNITVQNFDKKNERYPRNLTNYKVVKIDKSNGIVYGYGDVSGYVNNSFIATILKNPAIFNASSYENLWDNINDITSLDEDIEFVRIAENISAEVTSSLYNTFLDKVVTDQGFKDALAAEGISIPFGTNAWEDVASVVNANVMNSNNIDINFVDLNNSKTVTVRVNSKLTLQESTNMQSMINNFNNKTKSYEVVESKDFSTFPNP